MEDGLWRRDIFNEWFNQVECSAILTIPFSMTCVSDFWTWHFTKDGRYSVRSAYFVELKEQRVEKGESSSRVKDKEWMKIWKAAVPPKIQNFGWKCAHGGVPSQVNLSK